MKPLVSVMMPAYNSVKFIDKAIESMQAQTYQNWQLCIVNDGSTDLTAEVAQTYANHDARIVIDSITHGGCPVARNACYAMAEGDIIARLDADDTHDKVRLQRQVDYLLLNDTVDIVTCNMNWLRGAMLLQKKTGPMLPKLYLDGKSNGPCCASIVAWTKVYGIVGPFNPNYLAGSDGDWNFRALQFKWGHLDGYWYNQRRHNNQITKRLGQQQRQNHIRSRDKHRRQYGKEEKEGTT